MSRDRAEYMRAYRARRRGEEAMMLVTKDTGLTLIADDHLQVLTDRIAELEAEVRRLKQELALRAPRAVLPDIDRFGVAHPAPKPSQRHERRSAMNAERPK